MSKSVIRKKVPACATELWLEYLGITLDGRKVADQHFIFNLKSPITATLDRADLEGVMARNTGFDQLVAAGKATFKGNRKPFEVLMAAVTPFTPTVELLPDTNQ